MSTATRVVCIGAGYWGRNLVRNFHAIGALTGICDTSAEGRAELAAAYPSVPVLDSVDRVFADPDVDAVVIATPAETHGELVRRALESGKDVLVEKPLCLSLDEGQRLVDLAERNKRILMVGHLLWYHPAILKLKQLIDSGDLGKIQYVYSNRLNLGKIRQEENILWSFAPHDISVILGLLEEMPEQVHAQGGNYLQTGIADTTVSLLSFPSGVKGHIFVSWLHPFKEQKLVIVGERKMAVFNDLEKENKLVLYPHSIEWKNHHPVPSRAEGQAVPLELSEPLRAECEHFLECVKTRATPRTDGREALRVLAVLRECQLGLDSPVVPGTPKSAPVAAAAKPANHTVHHTAVVDDGVSIGAGTTIWHFSHILKNCTIGAGCRIGQNVVIGPNVDVGDGVKIQNNVSVYEGVKLEDSVFCGPSMVFTNVFNPRSEILRMNELRSTLVRKGASLGANCTIVCGITIGRYAFVGAGAVVLKDVPDFALVVGNPGRIVGWMCVCGNRIEFKREEGTCPACNRTYLKDGQKVTIASESEMVVAR